MTESDDDDMPSLVSASESDEYSPSPPASRPAAPNPPAASQPALAGKRVVINNLSAAAAQHNGRSGLAESFNQATGRYNVKIDTVAGDEAPADLTHLSVLPEKLIEYSLAPARVARD